MKLTLVFFFIVLTVFIFQLPAVAKPIDLNTSESHKNITMSMEVAESASPLENPLSLNFSPSIREITSVYSDKSIWLKFSLKNSSPGVEKKIIYFDAPLAGQLQLYQLQDGALVFLAKSGPGYSLAERVVPSRLGAFDFELNPGDENIYFIKRTSHHTLSTQTFLVEPLQFERNESQAKVILFFYLGGISCLVLYNIVLGIATGRRDYLAYSLFAGSFAVTNMALYNVIDTYLLPNSAVVFNNYLMFFTSATVIFASLFVERFLHQIREVDFGYWGARALRWSATVPLIGSFAAPSVKGLGFLGYWIDITVLLALIFFVVCGIYVAFKYRYALAYYFLGSWVAVMMGVTTWLASNHGIVKMNQWTHYSLMLANLAEMLILALGLAYKIRLLDEEKRVALAAAGEKERYQRLVKVLSHDVANMVAGMNYHTEVLSTIVAEPLPREHLSRIEKSTMQLHQVLSSVRAEELFQSMRTQASYDKVDILEACKEAVEHFSWRLREKGIRVIIQVPEEKYIYADRVGLVNQVLVNILSNSIKFSESGSEITMSFLESRTHYTLTVQDQGVGIPEQLLPTLFQGEKIFSRPGTHFEQGSGLGNKLVGEYMKLFKGRVEVHSVQKSRERKSGTHIKLIFPVHYDE